MIDFVDKAMSVEPATRLIVFPECATTGLPAAASADASASAISEDCDSELQRRFLEIADQVPGHTSERLGGVARGRNVYIATGFVEANRDNTAIIYNSSMLLGPDGEVVAIHRKVHTEWIFARGDDIGVYETAIGRIGLSICYDLWFPEFLRLQAIAGCQVHVNMTANQPAFSIGSTHFPVVRAAENSVYLISANRVGDDRPNGGLAYMGASTIVGPHGNTLAMGEREIEQIVYGRIALGGEKASPSPIRDRRTDLYEIIASSRHSQTVGRMLIQHQGLNEGRWGEP